MSRTLNSHGARPRQLRTWACALAAVVSAQGCTDATLESKLDEPRFINARIEQYCPPTGYEPASLFVVNYSLWLGGDGSFAIDSDRDGLSDDFELAADNIARLNVNAENEDTFEDGYGDLVIASLGMEIQDQNELSKCESVYQDSDRDDLDDCEETVVGTDEYDPDFDNDRIPDGVEVRYGLNPLDGEDARLDADQDGLSNADEIRQNTPLYRSNDDYYYHRATFYDVTQRFRSDGRECQQIDVVNIPIWNVENGNYIRFLFLERGFSVDHGTLNELRTVTLIVSRFYPEDTRIVVLEVDNQIQTEGFE